MWEDDQMMWEDGGLHVTFTGDRQALTSAGLPRFRNCEGFQRMGKLVGSCPVCRIESNGVVRLVRSIYKLVGVWRRQHYGRAY